MPVLPASCSRALTRFHQGTSPSPRGICNVYRQEFNWLYTAPEGGGQLKTQQPSKAPSTSAQKRAISFGHRTKRSGHEKISNNEFYVVADAFRVIERVFWMVEMVFNFVLRYFWVIDTVFWVFVMVPCVIDSMFWVLFRFLLWCLGVLLQQGVLFGWLLWCSGMFLGV